MSADNYYLVRKVGERFAVTCEFASDEEPSPIGLYNGWFTSFSDALAYANNQYSEYGVRLSKEIEDEQ